MPVCTVCTHGYPYSTKVAPPPLLSRFSSHSYLGEEIANRGFERSSLCEFTPAKPKISLPLSTTSGSERRRSTFDLPGCLASSHITLQPKTGCPLKLSRVKPGQYLDGRPPGKTRLLLEEVLLRPAGGAHHVVCVCPNTPV